MRGKEPSVPDLQYRWTSGTDPQTGAEIDEFFTSLEIEGLKERMCDMGRRLWQKDYVDGNGGNLSIRVGDNLVLCTPTMISKGFMRSEDMCLVDMEGIQVAGVRPCTSEILTHIGIMKRQPDAKACCHAHPPTATGFAIAGVAPPRFLMPESEVFLSEIGLAAYRTPGSPACNEIVGRLAVAHMAVFMCNHGVITRGKHIEMAYWRIEYLETLCRAYLVAREVREGEAVPQISGENAEIITGWHKDVSGRM